MTHRFLNGFLLWIRVTAHKQEVTTTMNRTNSTAKPNRSREGKGGVGDLTDDERRQEDGLADEAEGEVQESLQARRKVGQA
jgi:hypothetical protein